MNIKRQKSFLLYTIRVFVLLFLAFQIPNLISIFNTDATSNYEEIINKECNQTQCDYHGDSYYEIRNGFVYDKSTNEKTDGIYVENYITLATITRLINNGRDYYYSYRDGKEEDHLILRSLYSSTNPDGGETVQCIDTNYCDNLELDDSKKMNLQFNLSLNSSYNDVRINIDYLSLNRPGRIEINVLDYDSLRIYLSDASNHQYGPYKIENTDYLGVLQRKVKRTDGNYMDLFEDNYALHSENILQDTALKQLCQNSCDLKVKIVPFDTYHNENAFFNLKSISVTGYQDTYQKEAVAKTNVTNDVKLNIVNRMFENALIKYQPSQDFALHGNSITGNKAYKNIYTYFGPPYGSKEVGSKEEFISRINNEIYDASGEVNSFSCSTSALDAVATNIPTGSNLDWTGKYFYNSEVSVVKCLNNSNCADINRYTITGKTAAEIRSEINQDEIYDRYANLHYGDILAHKEVCTDLSLCVTAGHTILVTDNPTVVYDTNNKIDGTKSYVYATEITNGDIGEPVGQSFIDNHLDITQPNIASYLTNNNVNIADYSETRTQWRLSKKYSFDQLFNGEKVTVDTKTEQVYIPFTFNTYKDIASSGKIEKPYITFIYDDIKFQNYSNSTTNSDINDEIMDAVLTKQQMVGTIWSNYKITTISFKIGLKNNNTVTKTIYPTYAQNNPENRFSFYYDKAMETVNDIINSDIKSLDIDATVGNKSIKVISWIKADTPDDPTPNDQTPNDLTPDSTQEDDEGQIAIPNTGSNKNAKENNIINNYSIAIITSALILYIISKYKRNHKKIKFSRK